MSWGVATQNGVSVSLASIVSISCGATEFSPASLFTSGVQGAWYDPSDYSSLFQDSAGTTAVTAVEQPVGLMLDKSQGLVLGSELVNSPYSGTVGGSWLVSSSAVTRNGSSTSQASITLSTTISTSKTYLVQFTVADLSGDTFGYRVGGGTTYQVSANGTYTARVIGGAAAASFTFVPWGGSAGQATITNISVKELPGNHALQATTASRPVLRARYNLLTYSEQFDNAGWTKGNTTVSANAIAAPDGTTTADLLYPSSSGTIRWIYQTLTAISAVYTRSVYAKAQNKSIVYIDATGAGTVTAYFNLSSGTVGTVSAGYTATITAVGSGWYRCTMTNSTAAAMSFSGVYGVADADGSTTVTANGTDGIYLWGAQFIPGSSAGTYQRIAAATDYATTGFLPYLALVTDDSMATGSIDFSATNKMFVCAGVTKSSDAAIGLLVETSPDSSSATYVGAFSVLAPSGAASASYQTLFRGDVGRAFETITTYTAPITNVLSVSMSNQLPAAGDAIQSRINGAAVTGTESSNITTAGNFSNQPMFIGRRNNASLPLNGNIYQLIVVGKTLSASELASTEAFVNQKTGAY